MEDVVVQIDDFNEYQRNYTWHFSVPNPTFNFHCKYQIRVSDNLQAQQIASKGSLGYIMVQIE